MRCSSQFNAGGTLAAGTGNACFGGGSRTTINTGGTLAAAPGTTIELNGALLVNNGTVNGTVNVNDGSTAKGTGTYSPAGTVNVNFGGVAQDAGIFGTVDVTDGGRFGVNAPASGAATSGLSVERAREGPYPLHPRTH